MAVTDVFQVQYYSFVTHRWVDVTPDINPYYKIDLGYLIGFAKGLNYFYDDKTQLPIRVLKTDPYRGITFILFSSPSKRFVKTLSSKRFQKGGETVANLDPNSEQK